MKSRHVIMAGAGAVLAASGIFTALYHNGPRETHPHRVSFSRDIRPILNQHCTSCHGGVRQKNGVSFIYREEALGRGTSGRPTIVPGRPEASELVARVTSTDPEARMPYHAAPLPPEQIELLRQWIEDGAEWEDHWAFVAPKPQTLPAVNDVGWPKQPLDRFVLARLEKEQLSPSPEADKAALLRRVSFDLTGLPPTAAELSAFLADASANAYEKQVERLLASPHYGERWAALWLDLARYADSKGYEKDLDRPMWPYRDWVIDAFNRNLLYDQFVIAQLAGDLLPDPTIEDRIATSFQRQTPSNDEGGTDDEEFRLVAVMDRVATTWSVLNGLTINCVQCHSHPYDPIRHTEYYQSLAFYNTTRDADLFDDSPTLAIPKDAARRTETAELEQRKSQLLGEIVRRGRSLTEQTHWTPLPITRGSVNEALALERFLSRQELARRAGRRDLYPEPIPPELIAPSALRKYFDDAIAQTTSELSRIRQAPPVPLLALGHDETRAVGTIPVRSVFELMTQHLPSTVTALRIQALPQDAAKARHSPELGFIVGRVDAWIVEASGAERKVEFRYFAPDSEEILASAVKSHYMDGGFAANTKLFRTRWTIAIPEEPLRLEPSSTLKVQLTNTRGPNNRGVVRRLRLDTSSDPRWTGLVKDQKFTAQLAELTSVEQRLTQIPSVSLPVMVEQPDYAQRTTMEFERGNFLNKIGPALTPGVPALLPKLPDGAPRNRLTLAQWFFRPGQPLTARVAVNRYWEQLFGTGIVETLEDFGSSGQPPTHPELLDWLALHFQDDLRWDMKALLRELVTSATYRQGARVTPVLLQKDPRNRLLARGPQQRLTAEMVRDQALLASGLLSERLGGPPVMPPQPAGVWMVVYNDSKWIDATGPDRYRRALYTYLKRSAIYPSFLTFDASAHDVSLARRISTNTPLQALVTLNDPAYHEAAEALAKRMLEVRRLPTAGDVLAARLDYGANRVLSRNLLPDEQAAFKAFYEDARKMPRAHGAGSSGNTELAGLTAVAAVLLNLDEALTR